MTCRSCQAEVSPDEYAITRKLINRGLTWAYCRACLAKHYEVTVQDIDERIEYYRKSGCTLFEAGEIQREQ